MLNVDHRDPVFFTSKGKELRAACVRMAHFGKESHLNGALSSVDLLVALFYTFLKIDPVDPKHPERDRFIFSKGHACTSLYAILADRGIIPANWLERYATDDTPLPSHPCIHALPALEVSSGSLGHGLGMASGIAYALKLKNSSARAVALLSDGECNEGSTWEAATFAAVNKLDNVLAVVDYNGVQSIGRSPELMGSIESLQKRFEAFGWEARICDGLDVMAVANSLEEFPFKSGAPSVLIGRTKAGAGVSFMEDQVLWHYRTPSVEDLERALKELSIS